MPILEGEGPLFSVLEVGGCPPRLTDFLPGREITTVDVQPHQAAGYARARGDELPFGDKSFDLVLSLDTLEHVPPPRRGSFIAELGRTARTAVIVAAPFQAEAVRAADRAIFEFIRGRGGYDHPYLKEHVDLELPDLVATLVGMVDQGLDVQVVPSGRLDRWLFMMAAYYTLDTDPALRAAIPFLNEAYNRSFYDLDKAEPAYRHFLVGTYSGLGRRWTRLAELASGDAVESVDHRGVTMVFEMARVLGLKDKDQRLAALAAELEARDRELEALRGQVAALSDFQDRVKALPLYAFYQRYIKPYTNK